MNQNGYLTGLVRGFNRLHYIIKESFLIEVITKEYFMVEFLVILLKLF